jgi:ABC-2 type transport system permease protein
MNKLFAVIKREYLQRVRSRMFIITTILGPVMLIVFSVVPSLIFSIKAGGATKIAVVDQTGRLYQRIRASILKEETSNANDNTTANDVMARNMSPGAKNGVDAVKAATKIAFEIEEVPVQGDLANIMASLDQRVKNKELDGYVVLPTDVLEKGVVNFRARNLSDVFTREKLQDRISRAVVEQRMIDANIAPELVRQKSEPIKLKSAQAGGEGKEDKGGAFVVVFIVGFLIYLTILMYGQVILGAVVEEKETRIAEILFSSVKSFTLLIGKLIGVSLVALTQLTIWGLAFGAFAVYGLGMLAAQGMDVSLPAIQPIMILWSVLFFLLGYFLYATIYALLGSMVTTSQEGGQLALPIVFTLLAAFYMAFPVIRSPDSPFAFWVSMVPFFSPITMIVRLVTQPPPVWQILLSLAIGYATVVLIMWLAARIYRIGMLMYGKKASIPEVLRWIRQP